MFSWLYHEENKNLQVLCVYHICIKYPSRHLFLQSFLAGEIAVFHLQGWSQNCCFTEEYFFADINYGIRDTNAVTKKEGEGEEEEEKEETGGGKKGRGREGEKMRIHLHRKDKGMYMCNKMTLCTVSPGQRPTPEKTLSSISEMKHSTERNSAKNIPSENGEQRFLSKLLS